jgi:hypothetical protein
MKMLKQRVHPGMNTIQLTDSDWKLRYIADQDGKLMGWFEVLETTNTNPYEYEVYLALTGEQIPDGYHWVCSYQQYTGGGYFVVHAYD